MQKERFTFYFWRCAVLLVLAWLGLFWAVPASGQSVDAVSSQQALAQGRVFCEDEDYESAYPCLGHALPWLRATEDYYHTAYALVWMAEWHYEEDLPQALRWCREADSLLRHHPLVDTVSFYPVLLQSLGFFSSRVGLIDDQMGYYRRAFDLAMRVYDPMSGEVAEAYCDMGVAYVTRGSLVEGIAYFDSSIVLSKHCGYHDKLARVYNNAAYALADAGNLLKAVSYQQLALEHSDSSFLVAAYNNLGDYHLLLGNFEESLRCLERGLRIAQQEEVVSVDQVMVRVNMARVYFDMDDREAAYCIMSELLALPDSLVEDIEDLKQRVFLAQAVFAHRIGDYAEAVRFIDKGMMLPRLPLTNSFMHLVRAKSYIQLNEFDKAAQDVEECLALALPDFYRSAPRSALPPAQSVENCAIVAEILAAKGDLLHKQANVTGDKSGYLAALAVFSLADSLIQLARRGIQNRASREALSISIRDVYQGHMALLYSMYARYPDTTIFELALNVAEESKSLTLAEKMSDDDAKAFADVPSSVLARDRALAEDIRVYTEQVAKGGQDEDAWKKKLADKHLAQEDFLDSLELSYPNYYALRYQTKLVTLADIRQYLMAEDEVMLEYFLTEEAVFVLVLDRKEHRFLRLPLPRRPLAAQVLAYRSALLAPGQDWSLPAHDLYCALLSPVEELVAGKNLVLVPDDVLSYLPFDALLYEPLSAGHEVSARAFPYLLRRHRCRYLFSPGVAIQSLQRPAEAATKGILAMAPLYGGDLSVFLRAKGEKLGFLPNTAEELADIASRFEGAFLMGRRATEAYMKDRSADFVALHLATHTEIDEQQADHSALILADDGSQDGFLKAHELYTMRLRARLVTLSTCNTVNGRMQRGGGVASLARAFAYAGCPNLVATMWQVRDGTTAVLMRLMYGHIADGLPVNQALHQAKLDLLDNANTLHAHPALWGAFVYLGNEEVLVLPAAVPASGWGFYGSLLGLGLLLALWGGRRWRTLFAQAAWKVRR